MIFITREHFATFFALPLFLSGFRIWLSFGRRIRGQPVFTCRLNVLVPASDFPNHLTLLKVPPHWSHLYGVADMYILVLDIN